MEKLFCFLPVLFVTIKYSEEAICCKFPLIYLFPPTPTKTPLCLNTLLLRLQVHVCLQTATPILTLTNLEFHQQPLGIMMQLAPADTTGPHTDSYVTPVGWIWHFVGSASHIYCNKIDQIRWINITTALSLILWLIILDDQTSLQWIVNLWHDGERSNGLLKQDEAGSTLLSCCALSFSTRSRSDKWRLYPLCVPPHDIYLILSFFWLFFLVCSFPVPLSLSAVTFSPGNRCLKVLNALSQ